MTKTRRLLAAGTLAVGVTAGAAACTVPVHLPYGCHSDRHALVSCYQHGGGPNAAQAITGPSRSRVVLAGSSWS